MIETVIQFVLSAFTIIIAGTYLARASDSIAKLTNIGHLLAGSILLAGATSLPELFVDISAIRNGMPDIAVGDLLGSSLMNLMILAVADLSHQNPRKMFSPAGAKHALSAAMSINVTTLAAAAMLLGHNLREIGIGEIGIGTLAIGSVYFLGLRLVYLDQQNTLRSKNLQISLGRKQALGKALSVYFACALAVFIAAPFMAESAGSIAEISGLGKTFIGSTLVAFCTSLPELVSTIAAVRMGAFDLAVGNIFGSNSFNMLLLIPLDWIHEGNLLGAVSQGHVLTALGVILATSVAVMGQLFSEEKRKKIVEPDALAIIAVVVTTLYVLYWTSAT